MRFIKCLDISQVPVPTNQEVPQLVWVSTGDLYLDALISGEVKRIKISDIKPVTTLPAKPSETAIYRVLDTLRYYTPDGWRVVATTADLVDVNDKVFKLLDIVCGTITEEGATPGLVERVDKLETALDGVVERMENI
jgi:hypothetical protein